MLIMGISKFFHKVIYNNKPIAISQYFKQSMIATDNTRAVRHMFIKRPTKTMKTEKSFFYRGTRIYNSLPQYLKYLDHRKFNKKIKEVIRSKYSSDRVP